MWKLLGKVFSAVFIVRLFIGAATVSVFAWGVSFWVADWTTDKALTGAYERMQTFSENVGENRSEFRGEIRELVASLQGLQVSIESLDGLQASIESLDATVGQIDKRLSASINRQENFERFVTQYVISQAQPAVFSWTDAVTAMAASGKFDALYKMTGDSFQGWLDASKIPQ